jgi:hypothetical protein
MDDDNDERIGSIIFIIIGGIAGSKLLVNFNGIEIVDNVIVVNNDIMIRSKPRNIYLQNVLNQYPRIYSRLLRRAFSPVRFSVINTIDARLNQTNIIIPGIKKNIRPLNINIIDSKLIQ